MLNLSAWDRLQMSESDVSGRQILTSEAIPALKE